MTKAAQIEVGNAVAEVPKSQVAVPEAVQRAPVIEAMMEAAMKLGPAGGVEGVQALRELVALHREVAREDANRALIQAIAAFKAECPQIHRSKGVEPNVTPTGTTYKRRYAPLDAIERTVNPLLVKHGLSYTYDSEPDDKGRMVVKATLWHVSGASRSSSVSMPVPSIPNANDSQKAGGAFTYGMRYALLMVLGMATAEDDDGATDPGEDAGESLTFEQLEEITALWNKVGKKVDPAAFTKFFKVEQLADLPQSRFQEALGILKRKDK